MISSINLHLVHSNIYLLNGVREMLIKDSFFNNVLCQEKLTVRQKENTHSDGFCCVFFKASDFIRDIIQDNTIVKKNAKSGKILIFCEQRNIRLVQHIAHRISLNTGIQIVCVEDKPGQCLFKTIRLWILSSRNRREVIKPLNLSSAQFNVLKLRLKGYSTFQASIILGKKHKSVLNSFDVALSKLRVKNFNCLYLDFWHVRTTLIDYLSHNNFDNEISGINSYLFSNVKYYHVAIV